MKDPVRRDNLLTIVGLSIIAAVFVFAIYLPGYRAAARLRAEISTAEHQIREIPVRVAELELLHQRLEARRKYLQERGSVFAADPGVHEIIHEVALAGSRAGLEITRLEPLAPSSAASFQTLPFRLSFRGRYHACMHFVHALELQSRLMRIEDLRIFSESGKSGSVVQGELNFAVYARKAEKREVAEKSESAGAARTDKEFR